MQWDSTRRRFLTGSATVGVIGLAGCVGDDDEPADDGADDHDDEADDYDDEADDHDDDTEPAAQTYEVWAADQGLDDIHIYEGTEGSDEFEHVDEIDVSMLGGRPHMVHYTSDYEYAVATNVQGPILIDTESKEVVAELETGAGSHFTGFTPDDEQLVVDVIGDNAIVLVDIDWENEELSIADEIVPSDEIEEIEATQNPVCHSYDHNGNSIHTLGPAYGDGGVVVVDHDEFEIVESWHGEEMQANCGTMPHPTEDKFYLTAGRPTDPDGEEGLGYFYVLDTENYEVIKEEDANGIDTHGFWYTTDGEELWALNRETNNGVVIDPDTDEVIEDIDAFGEDTGDEPETSDAPDILWSSPDGQWMFSTLRGPEPVSGGPHAATGVTPGFSVLDTETKEIDQVVEPVDLDDFDEEDFEDEDVPTPDFHGIGVRPVGEFDVSVGTPPF